MGGKRAALQIVQCGQIVACASVIPIPRAEFAPRFITMVEEEWREVQGFPGYQASSWGRVRSTQTRHVKKPAVLQSGYHVMCLRKAGKLFNVKVHRIVAAAFMPQFDIHDAFEGIDHIDRDKNNNSPSNLRKRQILPESQRRARTAPVWMPRRVS